MIRREVTMLDTLKVVLANDRNGSIAAVQQLNTRPAANGHEPTFGSLGQRVTTTTRADSEATRSN